MNPVARAQARRVLASEVALTAEVVALVCLVDP